MTRQHLARGLYWAGWLNLLSAAALIAAASAFGPDWPEMALRLVGVSAHD